MEWTSRRAPIFTVVVSARGSAGAASAPAAARPAPARRRRRWIMLVLPVESLTRNSRANSLGCTTLGDDHLMLRRPHSGRFDAWGAGEVLVSTLRDASLSTRQTRVCDAPPVEG